ncbi:MAG: YebC/PmpR family DNA-binding transcriptional regulator [Verrucomicrobiota bacterium]|nr:YebC/PmpR family DNA-binding transcriptional regulator [Verrucomicrobiota bacterium]
MAGHSKWANIKHVKARQDAKRSKVFAKIAREITIAARIGGGDADMNPRLRLAIMKGRGSNMPADNIQRAIARGTGDGEGANFEELAYEIYGPHGVAILCEIATDNRNRTASEIRAILTRNEGKIATAGAVNRLFHRRGQLLIARDQADEDGLMEIVLEAGADDFLADEGGYEVLTSPEDFEAVHQAVEAAKITCESAQVTSLPELTVPVSAGGAADKVNRLVELLEDHDDVKEVFSNAEFAV